MWLVSLGMGGVEFVVWGPVVRADVPGLCERFGAAVAAGGGGRVRVDLRALDRPGPTAVEAVSRLALTARRLDCRVTFTGVDDGLRRLLAFLGLAELLADRADPVGVGEPGGDDGAGRQALGEPEQREEPLGVKEGVDAGDPTP
ncbi:STAS domain-containing protein [Streptomyces hainanensis]|uniref:STAS domain-containing protein n=1 Tax=Streptomyces hainanensis TaxID=402648 RepID=A0A4V2Y027_9ACTN|nr:STAS domain-containing protein [Streptomyces hainanensis]